MKQFAIKFQLWMPAVMRALLLCFISMAAAFASAVSGKTTKDLSSWGWLEWVILILAVLAAGATSLIAFLDQTMTYLKNKYGDTTFIERQGGGPR